MRFQQATAAAIAALLVAVSAGGCKRSAQAPMIAVSGKVTYEDGSLVPANQLELRFRTTQPELFQEKDYPATATARVDTRDGTFREMTTWQHGDGVIAGEYEVEVTRHGNEQDPGGFEAEMYRGDRVWPSKVTVAPDKTEFEIAIPKGR